MGAIADGSRGRPPGQRTQPVLLYDGECRFCRAMAHVVAARSKPDVLAILPWADDEAALLMERLDPAGRYRSMHMLLEDGRPLSGGPAFVRLLECLRGASCICWATRRWAAARWLVGFGYVLVARCRGPLSRVTPDRPPLVRR